MFALVLIGLVMSASTAPWYDPHEYKIEFRDSIDNFLQNYRQKLDSLNKKIENFEKQSKHRDLPKKGSNEYIITIDVIGFNKKDILVQATKGELIIQAIRSVLGEPDNKYLNERILPDFVYVNGSWSYNNGILTIVFPIIPKSQQDKYRRESKNQPKFFDLLPEKTNK